MGDFHQHGVVTTLHQLKSRSLESIENELTEFRKKRPLALVLPSLYSELEGPALSNIVDEIAGVPYLDQIVVGLDRASEKEYRKALEFFSRLPQSPQILWNDGPRLREIDELLKSKGLAPKEPGKGRNVWYMFGYVLAAGKAEAVAIHDCDITTYSRGLLARLIYPVAHPGFSYKFCKGYYARVANQSMNGRVCRLLVTPLLRALKKVCGENNYLAYLDSFRYPLAGEFSLSRDVIEDLRIPSDWGLEMGVLSEMQRNYATNQICQVDVADTYDHKHQDLSADDKQKGLSKMSSDIAKSLYRKMATQGEVFSREMIRTLKASYYRIALDLVDTYHDDAVMNGLEYDRHKEGEAVELFAENIMEAGYEYLDPKNSMEVPFMPSWKRVVSAVPDVLERLADAVELDMKEFGEGVVYDIKTHPSVLHLKQKLKKHVSMIYGAENAVSISEDIINIANIGLESTAATAPEHKWSEEDVMLITYGNSVKEKGTPPLQTLRNFLNEELKETVSTVHVLPFSPYSSDDGFSVIDYHAIDPSLGQWEDIDDLCADYDVMGDLVLNHCSAQSEWFQNYLRGKSPGKGYFVEGSDFEDLSQVVRPRSSPLLHNVQTVDGEKQVWCTFSEDQVDLNFSNPQVLLEMIRVIRLYMDHSIRYFRLDAIAFLWKESGTSCVHRPQTHEIIKLLRLVIESIDSSAVVITETNVPNKENLSYFGDQNGAHLIYNFSLPPLLLYTLLSGDCQHLNRWVMSMPPARPGRAYLNFIASHDGIGLRPAEDILSEGEMSALMNQVRDFGGEISMRRAPNGELKPYEANISLFDAMGGTLEGKDEYQMARYLCAHTIMLALEGLPAFYIHSLVGTMNDVVGFDRTGEPRSINRYQWEKDGLKKALKDESLHHGELLASLKELIALRKNQPAFHPNATQFTLNLGPGVFAFWRESMDRKQSIFAVHSISKKAQEINLKDLNLIETENWKDLISGMKFENGAEVITLSPYDCVWISN